MLHTVLLLKPICCGSCDGLTVAAVLQYHSPLSVQKNQGTHIPSLCRCVQQNSLSKLWRRSSVMISLVLIRKPCAAAAGSPAAPGGASQSAAAP